MANILDLIGNTPLVQLTQLDTGPCELFVKLENQNPGGSIKDRIALAMIEAAEREGTITAGGTLIEATAGNTGLALALVAVRKGYRLRLVVPDKMSQEKIFHLRALGAEVVMTRSDVGSGHPEYYHDVAERLARETPNSCYMNQFGNPANPLAHEQTTGPEIWEQMEHQLNAVVCGVGTGGTMAGLTHYFARVAPHVKMILADPQGSVLANYVTTGKVGRAGSWLVEGIGEDFIPPIADLSGVAEAFTIPDSESFATARELLAREAVRMQQHSQNALAIARWLEAHPKIERVIYPGLASHPQHALAKRQMRVFGGMVTIIMKGAIDDARRFLERCKIFALAESLGGVESLIEHPGIMTHASVPPQVRAQIGIGDTLVRLSVGIEDIDDLIADLAQALEA